MEEGRRFSVLSGGAFDISVQPLWRLYEAHFWSGGARGRSSRRHPRPRPRCRAGAGRLPPNRNRRRAHRLRPRRDGRSTLNSLAQGYITDAAADLLRNEGFESAFVDLGEIRALGRHPDGRPWRIGIRNGTAADSVDRMVELEDMALAVSGGYGTTFEPSGHFHHIFDPHTGASANTLLDVAVIGPTATAANGLSTAICVAGEARHGAARGLSEARGRS